jgi:hypothetical protein
MFGVIKVTLMVIMGKIIQKMHPLVNIFTSAYLPNVSSCFALTGKIGWVS